MRSRWYATIVAMTWAVGPTLGPGSAAEPADPRDKPPAGLPEALLQQTKPIFDGKSLDGWVQIPADSWEAKDSAMILQGRAHQVHDAELDPRLRIRHADRIREAGQAIDAD